MFFSMWLMVIFLSSFSQGKWLWSKSNMDARYGTPGLLFEVLDARPGAINAAGAFYVPVMEHKRSGL